MSNSKNIDWDEVIKKEERSSDNEDLGEVQETGQDYVLLQKGDRRARKRVKNSSIFQNFYHVII